MRRPRCHEPRPIRRRRLSCAGLAPAWTRPAGSGPTEPVVRARRGGARHAEVEAACGLPDASAAVVTPAKSPAGRPMCCRPDGPSGAMLLYWPAAVGRAVQVRLRHGRDQREAHEGQVHDRPGHVRCSAHADIGTVPLDRPPPTCVLRGTGSGVDATSGRHASNKNTASWKVPASWATRPGTLEGASPGTGRLGRAFGREGPGTRACRGGGPAAEVDAGSGLPDTPPRWLLL